MIIRHTTPEEKLRTDELFAIAFEMGMDRKALAEEKPEQGTVHYAAFDESGEMMSTFTVTDFPIRFDGQAYQMGGIGGVATLPQYRRSGGIRGCFNQMLPELYANGYGFSYLYPFSTYFYRKFGYECCVQKLGVTVDLGLLKPRELSGYSRLAEKSHPLTEAVRALDALWEARYNMMVLHTDEHYKWVAEADPAVSQDFTQIYFSQDGSPKAYMTFRLANQPDGRNLVCSRFCFADAEGYAGLMQVFKSLSADHRYAKFEVPADPAMQYLMPEWSQGAAQWSVRPAGMVRVIDAKKVLLGARYQGSGEVVLRLTDGQIPENNGCFRIVFADGKALSVEPTDAAPDAAMGINSFSALISGVCDFAGAALWFPGLEVLTDNPALGGVFYRKPLMIVDYF